MVTWIQECAIHTLTVLMTKADETWDEEIQFCELFFKHLQAGMGGRPLSDLGSVTSSILANIDSPDRLNNVLAPFALPDMSRRHMRKQAREIQQHLLALVYDIAGEGGVAIERTWQELHLRLIVEGTKYRMGLLLVPLMSQPGHTASTDGS